MKIALLVIGIVVVVNLAIWIPITRSMRRRVADMARELANERVEVGPERANYSGASSGLSKVRGTGQIALTERRLLFYKYLGKPVEIARTDIASVRTEKWFNGVRVGGRLHLVIKTASGSEVGFIVRDTDAWLAALGKTP